MATPGVRQRCSATCSTSKTTWQQERVLEQHSGMLHSSLGLARRTLTPQMTPRGGQGRRGGRGVAVENASSA